MPRQPERPTGIQDQPKIGCRWSHEGSFSLVILNAAPALSEVEGKDRMAMATDVPVGMPRGPSLRSGRQKAAVPGTSDFGYQEHRHEP